MSLAAVFSKKSVFPLITSFAITFLCSSIPSAKAQVLTYPPSKTTNDVDFYHGQKVFDPYRWLEDIDSPETEAWVETQTILTRSYLDSIAFRTSIKNRLTELWQSRDCHLPFRRGEFYFHYAKKAGENQYALYKQRGFDGISEKVLDPNPLSVDGTIAITAQVINSDGTLLAYALSSGGSDWQEVHFKELSSGREYDDILRWCKFVSLYWAPGDSGIYYDRWPEAGTVSERDQYHYRKLYYHRLGTMQSADLLVYENSREKDAEFSHLITTDGRYQILNIWTRGISRHDIFFRDLDKGGPFQVLKKKCESYYAYIDNIGTTLYFRTGSKAPGGRIVTADLADPEKIKWREVLPAADRVIDNALMIDSSLVIAYLENAYHKLVILDLAGTLIKEIELPAIGAVNYFTGHKEDTVMFVEFESFIFPPAAYIYNFNTGEFGLFDESQIDYDLLPYVTRQVQYESFGGITVPMFLTYRKDLELDGTNPTILYGYGGFGVSLLPRFSRSVLLWLECGGIYAVASIRGGGEYGWNWHRGGMADLKQVSFDDFANAAHWLIESKITSPAKLACRGASNGGLLVAACMEQNPNLFGAVICQVPPTDMIRYTKFTIGDKLVNEYGNPEADAATFSCLRKYSPYHNVTIFAEYPPILVTTGENDDRVPPLHAYKFVAALQAQDDGENPKLLRCEPNVGHGQGKPLSKVIEEETDILAFLFQSLKVFPQFAGEPSATEQPADSIEMEK